MSTKPDPKHDLRPPLTGRDTQREERGPEREGSRDGRNAACEITLSRDDRLPSGGRELLGRLMTASGADGAAVFESQLALQEVLSNALNHGQGGTVRLRFFGRPGSVMIAVTYATRSFDPAVGSGRLGARPGRGIPTIRAMVAKGGGAVEWRFGKGLVTVLLLKRWPASSRREGPS